ncbi:flagellar type III secretion system pore protein FliP [Bacillus sp. NEAU-CP5]|jgi:flagellar biosynthetic protein FliP|uniref:Flagellar biosynthetic protein FliP n=1 Tax=Bacillus velezensis (strain DSM 23117 / BGSC 10A6 / LMG 26770 / FZB42) TaxID=326423 RepID=A7Z4Q6_BACVZ|nr:MULTISPECIES: flagellar type III secretion system pore protein FliP [Bacillus]AIW37420.1 flagellar biosynthesis protein flip [Bacillus subtilis]ARM27816.1 flagellar biosynthetic protein FliP [Bacillus vallismortis]MBL3613161.1 flagellar type III secretion system pore protein FliP [Bacillus sp. RHFS18]ABS73982.1 flagellar type III secretion system pore protein FliP [Bacillus velezensis FZB42]AGZ56362.1 flagellar biosynthesis protein FliP [Bacillus amyloliquefaciens CC178]
MNEFINLFNSNSPTEVSSTVKLLLLLTVFSVAPGILILMTCFTRIVIVLSFVRTSLATQNMPPNQVLIGLALFLTFFIMAPTFSEINKEALTPLMDNKISLDEAYTKAEKPIKEYMSKHTRQKDLALFMNYAKMKKPESIQDIPLTTMVPAYAISELKTAFQMGFMIFIPFLIIDMVVASVLMSMGMMMLPPVMISLPFKILLFVLVDGWYLIVKSLLDSF